jgi:hypothetical protein
MSIWVTNKQKTSETTHYDLTAHNRLVGGSSPPGPPTKSMSYSEISHISSFGQRLGQQMRVPRAQHQNALVEGWQRARRKRESGFLVQHGLGAPVQCIGLSGRVCNRHEPDPPVLGQ